MQIPSSPLLSEHCKDLLQSLLQRDPVERISFEDFFDHPFIDLEHIPGPHCLERAVSYHYSELHTHLHMSGLRCML